MVAMGCDDGESPHEQLGAAGAGGVAPVVGDAARASNLDAAPESNLDAAASEAGAPTRSRYAAYAATLPVEAIFLGVCVALSIATDATMCRGIDTYLDCSSKQCDLQACSALCKEHLQCIAEATDRCPADTACPESDECLACHRSVLACTIQHCQGILKCATPTAGGPCAKVEECCKTQRDPTNCRGWLESQSQLAGDEGCAMLLKSSGFLRVYANDPPCALDAGP
jgi:hypothetical protein